MIATLSIIALIYLLIGLGANLLTKSTYKPIIILWFPALIVGLLIYFKQIGFGCEVEEVQAV